MLVNIPQKKAARYSRVDFSGRKIYALNAVSPPSTDGSCAKTELYYRGAVGLGGQPARLWKALIEIKAGRPVIRIIAEDALEV